MLIDINEIKISDRIRKDYGNLQELADDIKQNGLINPPVVTCDTYELIAGERRLRAMKLLGYKQIEVRPMPVKNAEHQLNLEISENEARKEFTKSERINYARQLERIERVKAEKRMKAGVKIPANNSSYGSTGETAQIIANKLGIGSKDTYRKEKYIVENKISLTPEDFADWDEGRLSTNKAFNKIKKEKETLEEKIKQLEKDYSKVKDNTDSEKIKQLKEKITKLESDKSKLELKAELNQRDADEFAKLKSEIAFLTKQKSDLSRKVDSATELAGLTVSLQDVLEKDLAPIKFKRCIEELDSSEIAVKNLIEILDKVDKWSDEMKTILGNKYNNVVSIQ